MKTVYLHPLYSYFCACLFLNIISGQINSQNAPNLHVKRHILGKRHASIVNYPCLVAENLGHPKLVLSEESHDISLECKKCQSKGQKENRMNKILWTFRKFELQKFKPVEIDQNNTFISPENSLLLEDLSTERAGIYKCFSNNGILISVYRVDIVKNEPRHQVFIEKNYKPRPPTELKENNIFVFTLWGIWSSCSRCDARGYRKRVGICTATTLNKDEKTLPVNAPLLQKYSIGVPCRSTALPKVIATLEPIKTRKSETEIKYCWEPCLEAQMVESVTDSNGNVIEVLKPKKLLSVHKVKPTIAPLVIRKTIIHDLGKLLILKCPTERHYNYGNDIVMWQNDSQILDAVTIWKDTLDRVHIDVLNRLVIEKTELWDNAAYSCWRKQQHLATIKVILVQEKPNSNDYEIYIYIVGVSLTLLLLLYVGISVFKNRNKVK